MPPVVTTIKVLVVDDDAEDVRLIADLFEDGQRAKFIVDSADTGAKGYQLLRSQRYDVVLLDYRLTDTDGLAFLKTVQDEHFKVPVVIITSHGDRSLQVRALEAGAAEYLEKGKIDAELLERTCLYAIGLQEKVNTNGSGPGVSFLMSQLVDLTRDSVKAQTSVRGEVAELRKDFGDRMGAMTTHIDQQHERVVTEVQGISKGRWFLEWIKDNTTAALIIFVCLIALIVVSVLLLNQLNTENLKALKDVTGCLSPTTWGIPWRGSC